MTTTIRLVLFAGLVASGSSSATAGVHHLMPIRDNTLFEDVGGGISNGAGHALFAGNTGTGAARRALLQFDLESGASAGIAIDSVVLTLHVSNAPNDTPQPFTLHRVLEDWGEGTSSASGGAGAPATHGDATWLHTFYPDQSWSTPGGDFDPTPSASQMVAGPGVYSWSGAALTADVEAWLSGQAIPHGWLLRGDEITGNTARRFDSREADDPAQRPTLTIHYRGTTSVRVSWGDFKTRYR